MKYLKILSTIWIIFVFFKVIISIFQVFPEICPVRVSVFCHVVSRHLKRENVDPEIGLAFLERFMDNCVDLLNSPVGHCITSDRYAVTVDHNKAAGIASRSVISVRISDVEGEEE